MSLSGSQKAYKQARIGIMRIGTSRLNYFTYNPVILINSVDRTTSVNIAALRVSQRLNDEPDTATIVLSPTAGFTPTNGQTVVIALGTSTGIREFAGQIVRRRHVRRENNKSPWIELDCVDWSRLYNRRLVNNFYQSASATDIVKSMHDSYSSGFTRLNVQEGLATIDFISAILEPPMQFLRRLANMIGGGCYIDSNKDLHFFGSTGETGSRAPSPPQTLTNTLDSLKSFSHEYDDSQLRTRALVETKGGQTLADVASGQTAIPLDDASNMDVTTCVALIDEYGTITFSFSAVFAAGTTVKTAAAVGAVTVELDNVSIIAGLGVGVAAWVKAGDQFIYCTGSTFTAAPAGNLTGIPSSGAGSILAPLSVGDPIVNIPMISGISGGVSKAIKQGTYVAPLTTVNDAAAQAVQAALDSGDGIYEAPIRDRRFNQTNATALGTADLTNFKSSLTAAEWETEDLNARVGAMQVVNLTGADSLSVTLMITAVDVEFRELNLLPRRKCKASVVKLPSLSDLTQTEQGR
jgi:hypothetical protein